MIIIMKKYVDDIRNMYTDRKSYIHPPHQSFDVNDKGIVAFDREQLTLVANVYHMTLHVRLGSALMVGCPRCGH